MLGDACQNKQVIYQTYSTGRLWLWPFSHDGNLRILKFNCKCAFWNTQRTHERSTSVFWITHRTHERSRNVILERAKRRVWVACQSKHARVLFTFPLHVCSTVRRRKWFEGHASSAHFAPTKHDSEVKSFTHRLRCVICENRICKTPLHRHLRCAFQNTSLDVFWRTHGVFCVFWNLIVNAHLQLNFKIRKFPSCENSLFQSFFLLGVT